MAREGKTEAIYWEVTSTVVGERKKCKTPHRRGREDVSLQNEERKRGFELWTIPRSRPSE